jgi:hypothetical protein
LVGVLARRLEKLQMPRHFFSVPTWVSPPHENNSSQLFAASYARMEEEYGKQLHMRR